MDDDLEIFLIVMAVLIALCMCCCQCWRYRKKRAFVVSVSRPTARPGDALLIQLEEDEPFEDLHREMNPLLHREPDHVNTLPDHVTVTMPEHEEPLNQSEGEPLPHVITEPCYCGRIHVIPEERSAPEESPHVTAQVCHCGKYHVDDIPEPELSHVISSPCYCGKLHLTPDDCLPTHPDEHPHTQATVCHCGEVHQDEQPHVLCEPCYCGRVHTTPEECVPRTEDEWPHELSQPCHCGDYHTPELPHIASEPCYCGRIHTTEEGLPLTDADEAPHELVQYCHCGEIHIPERFHIMSRPCFCGRTHTSPEELPSTHPDEQPHTKAEPCHCGEFHVPELRHVIAQLCHCGRIHTCLDDVPPTHPDDTPHELVEFCYCGDVHIPALPHVISHPCYCGRIHETPEEIPPAKANEAPHQLSPPCHCGELHVPSSPHIISQPCHCGDLHTSPEECIPRDDDEEPHELAAPCHCGHIHSPEPPHIISPPCFCGRLHATPAEVTLNTHPGQPQHTIAVPCHCGETHAEEVPHVISHACYCSRVHTTPEECAPCAPAEPPHELAHACHCGLIHVEPPVMSPRCYCGQVHINPGECIPSDGHGMLHELATVCPCGEVHLPAIEEPVESDESTATDESDDTLQVTMLAAPTYERDHPHITTEPCECGRRHVVPVPVDVEEVEEHVTSQPCDCGRKHVAPKVSEPTEMRAVPVDNQLYPDIVSPKVDDKNSAPYIELGPSVELYPHSTLMQVGACHIQSQLQPDVSETHAANIELYPRTQLEQIHPVETTGQTYHHPVIDSSIHAITSRDEGIPDRYDASDIRSPPPSYDNRVEAPFSTIPKRSLQHDISPPAYPGICTPPPNYLDLTDGPPLCAVHHVERCDDIVQYGVPHEQSSLVAEVPTQLHQHDAEPPSAVYEVILAPPSVDMGIAHHDMSSAVAPVLLQQHQHIVEHTSSTDVHTPSLPATPHIATHSASPSTVMKFLPYPCTPPSHFDESSDTPLLCAIHHVHRCPLVDGCPAPVPDVDVEVCVHAPRPTLARHVPTDKYAKHVREVVAPPTTFHDLHMSAESDISRSERRQIADVPRQSPGLGELNVEAPLCSAAVSFPELKDVQIPMPVPASTKTIHVHHESELPSEIPSINMKSQLPEMGTDEIPREDAVDIDVVTGNEPLEPLFVMGHAMKLHTPHIDKDINVETQVPLMSTDENQPIDVHGIHQQILASVPVSEMKDTEITPPLPALTQPVHKHHEPELSSDITSTTIELEQPNIMHEEIPMKLHTPHIDKDINVETQVPLMSTDEDQPIDVHGIHQQILASVPVSEMKDAEITSPLPALTQPVHKHHEPELSSDITSTTIELEQPDIMHEEIPTNLSINKDIEIDGDIGSGYKPSDPLVVMGHAMKLHTPPIDEDVEVKIPLSSTDNCLPKDDHDKHQKHVASVPALKQPVNLHRETDLPSVLASTENKLQHPKITREETPIDLLVEDKVEIDIDVVSGYEPSEPLFVTGHAMKLHSPPMDEEINVENQLPLFSAEEDLPLDIHGIHQETVASISLPELKDSQIPSSVPLLTQPIHLHQETDLPSKIMSTDTELQQPELFNVENHTHLPMDETDGDAVSVYEPSEPLIVMGHAMKLHTPPINETRHPIFPADIDVPEQGIDQEITPKVQLKYKDVALEKPDIDHDILPTEDSHKPLIIQEHALYLPTPDNDMNIETDVPLFSADQSLVFDGEQAEPLMVTGHAMTLHASLPDIVEQVHKDEIISDVDQVDQMSNTVPDSEHIHHPDDLLSLVAPNIPRVEMDIEADQPALDVQLEVNNVLSEVHATTPSQVISTTLSDDVHMGIDDQSSDEKLPELDEHVSYQESSLSENDAPFYAPINAPSSAISLVDLSEAIEIPKQPCASEALPVLGESVTDEHDDYVLDMHVASHISIEPESVPTLDHDTTLSVAKGDIGVNSTQQGNPCEVLQLDNNVMTSIETPTWKYDDSKEVIYMTSEIEDEHPSFPQADAVTNSPYLYEPDKATKLVEELPEQETAPEESLISEENTPCCDITDGLNVAKPASPATPIPQVDEEVIDVVEIAEQHCTPDDEYDADDHVYEDGDDLVDHDSADGDEEIRLNLADLPSTASIMRAIANHINNTYNHETPETTPPSADVGLMSPTSPLDDHDDDHDDDDDDIIPEDQTASDVDVDHTDDHDDLVVVGHAMKLRPPVSHSQPSVTSDASLAVPSEASPSVMSDASPPITSDVSPHVIAHPDPHQLPMAIGSAEADMETEELTDFPDDEPIGCSTPSDPDRDATPIFKAIGDVAIETGGSKPRELSEYPSRSARVVNHLERADTIDMMLKGYSAEREREAVENLTKNVEGLLAAVKSGSQELIESLADLDDLIGSESSSSHGSSAITSPVAEKYHSIPEDGGGTVPQETPADSINNTSHAVELSERDRAVARDVDLFLNEAMDSSLRELMGVDAASSADSTTDADATNSTASETDIDAVEESPNTAPALKLRASSHLTHF